MCNKHEQAAHMACEAQLTGQLYKQDDLETLQTRSHCPGLWFVISVYQ